MVARKADMTQERKKSGFTLIELLVVLAVIAILLTIALPRYFSSLEKSREAVLQQNLALLRESLDKYHADKGKYPAALDELVSARYLRNMPLDPITESNATWISIPPAQPEMGGVYDVRSGAQGVARDGREYQKW
jgi:general secretion pathway protein G